MNTNLGCQWYYEKCIDYFSCNQFDFQSCENTPGKFKDKCEWYTQSSSTRYCQAKSKIDYIDNCKDITYDDCQKGINGCYWISGKCILPIQCLDFNRAICRDIKSYSSFEGKCEWNESTKKCQRKPDLYGVCRDNLDENDCNRHLIGCTSVNNKCVDTHQCFSLFSSVCENLNNRLRSTCEWDKIKKKMSKKS